MHTSPVYHYSAIYGTTVESQLWDLLTQASRRRVEGLTRGRCKNLRRMTLGTYLEDGTKWLSLHWKTADVCRRSCGWTTVSLSCCRLCASRMPKQQSPGMLVTSTLSINTHTLTHSLTHSLTRSHTHTHTHTHTLALNLTHTCTHLPLHTHPNPCTHVCAHTHTLTHA